MYSRNVHWIYMNLICVLPVQYPQGDLVSSKLAGFPILPYLWRPFHFSPIFSCMHVVTLTRIIILGSTFWMTCATFSFDIIGWPTQVDVPSFGGSNWCDITGWPTQVDIPSCGGSNWCASTFFPARTWHSTVCAAATLLALGGGYMPAVQSHRPPKFYFG